MKYLSPEATSLVWLKSGLTEAKNDKLFCPSFTYIKRKIPWKKSFDYD
jgi:hypothetical protein